MNGKNINFYNKNIKKSDFYDKNKKIFNIDHVDVNKILVSKKEHMVNIIYLNALLGIMIMMLLDHYIYFFSQTTGYINKFDKNEITMSIMVKGIQRLKNYNKICKKIEKLMKIDFKTKTTYRDNEKYIKTKIKTYKDSIITNFHNKKGSKKIPEEKIPHKCLSIIILDSIIYAYEKYYP